MKWAITEQFHEYLYGNAFDVYTDNNPLTYVLTTAKLDAMGHRWIAGLANYNFHIHYNSRKSNVEQMLCLGLIGRKVMKPFKLILFRLIVTAAITGQGNDHIEAIPCSPQTIESILPFIPDNAQIVCKAKTWSSRQSCLTCLKTESCVLETESKLGDSSQLRATDDPALNLKCMTTSDWIEAQSKNKIVGDIIKMYKAKELQKGREIDSQEMRQFLKQRSKLFLRNRIYIERITLKK